MVTIQEVIDKIKDSDYKIHPLDLVTLLKRYFIYSNANKGISEFSSKIYTNYNDMESLRQFLNNSLQVSEIQWCNTRKFITLYKNKDYAMVFINDHNRGHYIIEKI